MLISAKCLDLERLSSLFTFSSSFSHDISCSWRMLIVESEDCDSVKSFSLVVRVWTSFCENLKSFFVVSSCSVSSCRFFCRLSSLHGSKDSSWIIGLVPSNSLSADSTSSLRDLSSRTFLISSYILPLRPPAFDSFDCCDRFEIEDLRSDGLEWVWRAGDFMEWTWNRFESDVEEVSSLRLEISEFKRIMSSLCFCSSSRY